MPLMNDTCNLGPTFWFVTDKLRYVETRVFLPIHVLLGIPGQIICVIACVYQSKTNSAYAYQTFCTISDIFELTAFAATYIAPDRVAWVQECYPLLWYSTYLAIPLMHITMINSLFASVAMAFDRLLALAKPIQYKNFNHKRRRRVCFAVCVLSSIALHIFEAFRAYLDRVDGRYKLIFDYKYSSGLFANFSAQFVNALRFFGVVILIGCNGLVVYFYRNRHVLKIDQLAPNDRQTKKAREDQEKCLFVITIFQAFFVSMTTFGEAFFTAAFYAWKDFVGCGYSFITSPILGILHQTSMVWEFYVWLAVSRQFRRLVRDALRRSTQVHPISM